jgi:signal transduction histidine kinase
MNAAAIATWVVAGLSPLVQVLRGGFTGWPAAAYVAAFLLFGAALFGVLFRRASPRLRGTGVALAAVQSVAALVMLALAMRFSGSGNSSAALVIVAAELPYITRRSTAWLWIAAQTAGTALALRAGRDLPWIETMTFAAAMGGFQLFAASSSILARSQAEGRAALARVNEELRATRARLADSTRAEERLRISRDLHDALGHHLTALSLQLDVASRLVEGRPAEHVARAHAIARLLLGDVRDVVSRMRDTGPVDLVKAMQALSAPAPGVALHLHLPDRLALDDRDQAQALLRCAQEVITNTGRHAAARNLWLQVEARDGGVVLTARDDGRGTSSVAAGHGLTGMQERFAEHRGTVEFSSQPGGGFSVRAFMPVQVAR